MLTTTSAKPRLNPLWTLGGVALLLLIIAGGGGGLSGRIHPFFWGSLALIWYLTVAALVAGRPNPLFAVVGEDGRLSASKFQFFLWTGVVVFAYVTLVAERVMLTGALKAVEGVPQNLLIAMGFSITTLAGAKGITVSYVSSGRILKRPTGTEHNLSIAGLFAKDDLSTPDLSKIQMLTWTLIGVTIYTLDFVRRHKAIAGTGELPDIDAVLMVLMGLGQGAYLGGKLTMADVPGIAAVDPARVLPGGEVTVRGGGFGAAQGFSALSLAGGAPITATRWLDDTITFRVPMIRGDGSRWAADEPVSVGLAINGRAAQGGAPLRIAFPDVANAYVSSNATIVMHGGPFGPPGAASKVTVGAKVIQSQDQGVTWSNEQIVVPVADLPKGTFPVAVDVNGYRGRSALVTI